MIRLDYAGCMSERVGSHGLDAAMLDGAAGELAELTHRLGASSGTGWERWRTLCTEPVRSRHVEAVRTLVTRHRDACENLVVLGIGGSALGNIALQQALRPLTWNLLPRSRRDGPRLFVLDNVDPALVADTLACIRAEDPRFERTLVNVISKSGETAETAAQFLVVRSMLRDACGDAAAQRIIATTDPEGGTMRGIADRAGFATLPVPEGVGGRFSVLSPVGLFSAAMCGIDIDALLRGAAAMDERCRNEDALANPAAVLAWLLVTLMRRGKPNHVLMPYRNALVGMADWYKQLWAESLGKRYGSGGAELFAGATPINALGATDQHSQIQLYREGPNDKVIGFVETDAFEQDVPIPSGAGVESLAYLEGATLGRLLAAEKRATEYALLESERPHYTLHLDRLDAEHIGGFIQLWMVTTAYAGLLMDIDAYDQPAVETGKKATFGLMGRAGFEAWRAKVDGALGETAYVV